MPQKQRNADLFQLAVDALISALALLVAHFCLDNLHLDESATWHIVSWSGPLALFVTLLLFASHTYQADVRYFGFRDISRIAVASAFASSLCGTASLWRNPSPAGLGILPVVWLFAASGLIGARTARRALLLRRARALVHRTAIIAGAGDAGAMIAREMLFRGGDLRPIAFVDDDPRKLNRLIHGIRVAGTTADLPELIAATCADEVLIAMPSADGAAVRRVFNICKPNSCRIRVLPGVPEIIFGDAHVSQFRPVTIEDLVRRPQAHADIEQASAYLRGRRILVTGAGGSIGAELCRQIVRFDPASLVLLDHSENAVFELQQELIESNGFSPTCTVLDLRDRRRLAELWHRESPQVVVHAAAHKHVPLMEADPIEAVQNNVGGTLNVVELLAEGSAEAFIYVSTDKAVCPSSVMGATKRIGEMIVAGAAQTADARLAVVRFGNVLGSRGSLLPTLERQIAQGGPVRLTDPEMTRYFMTIPEASQLILQAGAMGKRAEKYLLDMGEPVRIVDLAHDLIRLHGLVPDVDIAIEFTGARPGEKLSEQLVADTEAIHPTAHPRIFVAPADLLDVDELHRTLNRLALLASTTDSSIVRSALMDIALQTTDADVRQAA